MLERANDRWPAAFSSPWLVAGLIHIVCTIVWGGISAANPGLLNGREWLWLEGTCAAAAGVAAGMPLWWLPINIFFAPAVSALQALAVPPSAYLAGFCALLLLNCGAWSSRVPLFLSSAQAAARLVSLLPARPGFRVLDLGCGTGSLLERLVRARPDGCYEGIELAPLPLWLSRWRARRHASFTVRWGDFWSADLSRYDVVYAYLSPAPMRRIWEKANREMRPGSLFVSNGFPVPGIEAPQQIDVGDFAHSTLHVWRM